MGMTRIKSSGHRQHISIPTVFFGFRVALETRQDGALQGIVGLGFQHPLHGFTLFLTQKLSGQGHGIGPQTALPLPMVVNRTPIFPIGAFHPLVGMMSCRGVAQGLQCLVAQDCLIAVMKPDEGADHGHVGIGAHTVLGAPAGILCLEITHGVPVIVSTGLGIYLLGIDSELPQRLQALLLDVAVVLLVGLHLDSHQ